MIIDYELIAAWSVLIFVAIFGVLPIIGSADESANGYLEEMKSGFFISLIILVIAACFFIVFWALLYVTK